MDQHEGAAVQPHHPPAPRQELCVWAGQEEGHEDDQRSLPCPAQDHGGLWGLAIIVKKVTIVALGISFKSTSLALKSIHLHLSPGSRVNLLYHVTLLTTYYLSQRYHTFCAFLCFILLAECRHYICINDDCSGDSCWAGERTVGRI